LRDTQFGENMAGGVNPSKNDMAPEAVDKPKKQSNLNALILAGVFVLGVVLPTPYKALAPFLFLLPFILKVIKKIRQSSEISGTTPQDQTYNPSVPNRIPSIEPYSHTPTDPKDPRRYKPIG